MIGRFRVATTSTGRRRQVYVHLYDDREEMAHRHAEARQIDYSPDTAGGVSIRGGWRWPSPDQQPLVVMRLWTEQLTVRTVSHEALHAAALLCFMDVMPGWDSRQRTLLLGDNEPLAYTVGDLTAEVTKGLHHLGHAVTF